MLLGEPVRRGADQQSRVLVVDDNELNRSILSRRLVQQGFEVVVAADGLEALERLAEAPCALVLLDIIMPRMDGYELLEHMKADPVLRHIPVIVITALNESDSAAKCIEMGAEDYLTKPFNPVLLRARLNASLEKTRWHYEELRYKEALREYNSLLEQRVQEQVRAISSAQLATILATSKLAESRDPETGAHLERIREYCRVLARQLSKMPKHRERIDARYVETIYAASPLHDIGKVAIPDGVLLKPDALDGEEWEIMKRHTVLGAETLRAVDRQHPGNGFIQMGIDIAQSHHEKWDGSGYPEGLAGDSIPLAARILALGDVYDALTSRRCYKEAFGHEESKASILRERGRHFDPDVVDAFLATEREFLRIRTQFQDPGD